ncbi:hypothetical protein TNCV_3372981, partial [Trichonephila clavipes]
MSSKYLELKDTLSIQKIPDLIGVSQGLTTSPSASKKRMALQQMSDDL